MTNLIAEETIALRSTLSMEWRRFPELVKSFYEQDPSRIAAVLGKYLDEQVQRGRLRNLNPQVGGRQFIDLLASEMITRAAFGIFPPPNDQRKTKEGTRHCRILSSRIWGMSASLLSQCGSNPGTTIVKKTPSNESGSLSSRQ
jgi:hypothetical protein